MTPEPVVTERAVTPPGNLPKLRKSWVLMGLTVVVLLVIFLMPKPTEPKTGSARAAASPPSKNEIEQYRVALKDQQDRARLAEAEMMRAKEVARQNGITGTPSTGVTPAQSGIPGQAIIGADGRVYVPAQPNGQATTPPAPAQLSPEEQDRRRREYTSLFASNVALSLRPATPAVEAPHILEPVIAPPPTTTPALAVSPHLDQPDLPTHLVFEGGLIEAVLTNRLEGGFTGPVNCQVTTALYSHDHQTLLIPQGSRVLGEAKRVAEQQQQRLAIVFHRLIMPDGFDVSLDQMPGLDQAGATGLKDKTNNHYLEIFGTSIALGVLSGFSQFGTGSALTAGGLDSYRQGVAGQVAQNNSTILQRQLNRLPDITIREGHRVKIYLTRDLALPAYDQHTRRTDL